METKVHLYMATLPDRVDTLKKSLHSLADQVDTIQVVLNNMSPLYLYPEFNELLRPVQIKYFKGTPIEFIEHDNSLQDDSRFINAHKKPGYCLVCDDDIEYPPDFVGTMVKQYEELPSPGFLSVMGKVLKPRPLKSYYKGWKENYRTFDEIKELQRVDIPGCCGILWHTDVATLSEGVMNIPNSDVCVGVDAKRCGLPCYVIPHSATWLKNLMPELPKDTLSIYGRYKNNDKIQTDYINRWM